MKEFSYNLFVVVSILLSITGSRAEDVHEWGPVTNNLQMSIALADGTNVIAGKDFCLTIFFRTKSTNEFTIAYKVNGTTSDPSYSFEITSPSGRDVSPNTSKLKPPMSGGVVPILPNEVASIRFDLGELCRLDESGTYKIVVKKNGLFPEKDEKSPTLISNPLLVKVVPAKN